MSEPARVWASKATVFNSSNDFSLVFSQAQIPTDPPSDPMVSVQVPIIPVAVVAMSPTLAKELLEILQRTVAVYEANVGIIPIVKNSVEVQH